MCWSCRIGVALLAAALILATGGAGIPAAGAALAATSLAVASEVSVAACTAAVGGLAGMTLAMAIDWLCCNLFRVKACC